MAPQAQDNLFGRVTAALVTIPWWVGWGTGSNAAKLANDVTTTGVSEPRVAAFAARSTKMVLNDSVFSLRR
jgi:hypothetical protein